MDSEVAVANSKEECLPIDNVKEVLKWNKPNTGWPNLVKPRIIRAKHCFEGYTACSDFMETRIHPMKYVGTSFVPKTLVCHDMKGGYGADRFINGTDNPNEYKFLTWTAIDIFIYFSHKLVTIPPLCWINAGHTHGVKVLGTLITEGETGYQIWDELLKSKKDIKRFSKKLADICQFYGFDGYLINIENKIVKTSMDTFIQFFDLLVKNVKAINNENVIIWYDAVCYPSGVLRHQNKLNDQNRIFFDKCDGIFLNYDWTEEALIETVKNSNNRLVDIYVGIDIFGRSMPGGFYSNKSSFLIRKNCLSIAYFAPGWVHENCEPQESVDKREFKFWKLLDSYLYSYGPAQLPFQTSFCRGYGHRKYKKGKVISNKPWFNLSEMNHMPGLLSCVNGVCEWVCYSYYQDDAYNGGGCLLIKPNRVVTKRHFDRLICCDFHDQTNRMLYVTIISKPLVNDPKAFLKFNFIVTESSHPCVMDPATSEKIEYNITYDDTGEKNDWKISEFPIYLNCRHITNIECDVGVGSPSILLGYFSVEECKFSSSSNVGP